MLKSGRKSIMRRVVLRVHFAVHVGYVYERMKAHTIRQVTLRQADKIFKIGRVYTDFTLTRS